MSAYSFATWFMVALAVGILIAGKFTPNSIRRLLCGTVIACVPFLLEVFNLSIVGYLRAVLAEPSIGLVVHCAFLASRRLGLLKPATWADQAADRFLTIVFVVGILLYPMALGLGMFDPYALGYRPETALVVSVLAAVVWWQGRNCLVAVWLTLSVCTYAFQLGEGSNLIDHLLDPVVFGVAATQVALRRLFPRITTDSSE